MRLVIFLCLAVFSLQAIEKNDFAYMKSLELSKDKGLIKIELSPEIYKGLVHSDLSDLAVFDVEGRVMPSEVSTSMNRANEQVKKELPFVSFDVFKIDENQQLRFEYEGAKIEMLSTKERRSEDYILDTRGFKTGVKTLFIEAKEKKYMLPVDVLCSQDLQKWKIIKARAVVASFDFQDSFLEKNSIDLPQTECAYLRLQADTNLSILKIEAQAFSKHTEAVLKTQRLVYEKEKDGIAFEVSKNLRVHSLNFELEDKEQFYKIEVYGKNRPEQKYRKIKQAEIYTIADEDTKLKQHKISLSSRFNYYKLKPVVSSYLPIDTRISYSYKEENLYFLAQGKAPYTLAFGSLDTRVSHANIRQGSMNGNLSVKAELSKTRLLGGKEKLLKQKPSSLRYWVWLSLLIGVLLLGFMSWSLFKQMKEA